MYFSDQETSQKEYYERMLKMIGSLSGLYSDSDAPYLHYRTTENLFCKAFLANNLSRGDTSADASKNGVGFGIKTFLNNNGNSFQKVAEFNKDYRGFSSLPIKERVIKIAELRNERIEATKRIHGLNDIVYHCITREPRHIFVFETPMEKVDISAIRDIKADTDDKSIKFSDGLNEYNFNITKSTLLKRFKTENVLMNIEVDILKDPFETLEKLFADIQKELVFSEIKEQEHIFLPLYSSTKAKGRFVPEKSGLNQWNAAGRERHYDEVYIPIPSWVHKEYAGFFPPRDVPFELRLPNGKSLKAKLCQDGSKALMSDPNKALGEWLLRDVMALKNGELLTINRLDEIGLDSVVLYKIAENVFEIDFTQTGSFEEFKEGKPLPEETEDVEDSA